jgi:hypothetical protein
MMKNVKRFDAVKNGEYTTIALWESEDGEYVRYSVLANYAHSLKVCIGQKIKLRDERDALATRVAELEVEVDRCVTALFDDVERDMTGA